MPLHLLVYSPNNFLRPPSHAKPVLDIVNMEMNKINKMWPSWEFKNDLRSLTLWAKIQEETWALKCFLPLSYWAPFFLVWLMLSKWPVYWNWTVEDMAVARGKGESEPLQGWEGAQEWREAWGAGSVLWQSCPPPPNPQTIASGQRPPWTGS